MRARFLLDVEIDGVVHRWSDGDVDVLTSDGEVVSYVLGLGELELAQGEEEIEVEVVDPSIDWPARALELDGRLATLRRWVEGTVLEQAETYARGEAAELAWGSRDEPIRFTLAAVSGSDLGLGSQVPEVLARVDETTWPITGVAGDGTVGASYPVIFGYPGFTGATDPECVVPVPMGQWFTSATTHAIVSEDADLSITECRIRNDALDITDYQTVGPIADNLGRPVLTATFGLNPAGKPTDKSHQLYAGFRPSGGGGKRSAYDVVEYLLRRWGPETYDRTRLPEIRDEIGGYMVDTWIEQPISDPWAWIEGVLAPDLLLDVRTSARGRYLVSRRYVADGTRRVGRLSVDRGEAYRVSEVSRSGRPINEFTAVYRESRAGDYTARLVLSGHPTLRSALGTAVPTATDTQPVVHATTRRCQESLARYRRRQDPDGPLELDWSWETGTVLRCLERRAERDAIPGLLATYEVDDGEDLVEGDELELDDAEQGFAGRLALVDAPPVRGAVTTVALRIEP